jgi:hypothetical protein
VFRLLQVKQFGGIKHGAKVRDIGALGKAWKSGLMDMTQWYRKFKRSWGMWYAYRALADGKVSTNVYLRRVHNHALGMEWLLKSVVDRSWS